MVNAGVRSLHAGIPLGFRSFPQCMRSPEPSFYFPFPSSLGSQQWGGKRTSTAASLQIWGLQGESSGSCFLTSSVSDEDASLATVFAVYLRYVSALALLLLVVFGVGQGACLCCFCSSH